MRGQGRVFQPKWKDGAGVVRVSPFWSIDYSLHGRRFKEKTGLTSQREAMRLLRQRIDGRESGKIVGHPEKVLLAEYATEPDGTKKLVGGLRWLHETQYDLDGLRSKDRMQLSWNNLERFFEPPTRVTDVTPLRLDAYAQSRLAEGAARQTVNNELSVLRRGFNLAIEKGLISTAPAIKLPRVENAREGFFEDGDFAAVLLALPAYAQPVVRFLRVTGWRVEEALTLTWDRIDLEQEGIRLSARQTKGKQARLFPFGLSPDLKDVLTAAWAARDGLFVFQGPRKGERLGYTTLLHHWQRATKQAGCAGRLMHDLRRDRKSTRLNSSH